MAGRVVYSTDKGRICPACGWPARDCTCSTRSAADEPVPTRLVAKLRMEKAGRGGKTVTLVDGLPRNAAFLRGLAQELKRLFASDAFGGPRKSADFLEDAKKFFVNYFKQIALVFGGAWNGRKYSIRSAPALRAFIRVAPDVIRRLDQEHADRSDFRAIGRVIAPWGRRIGDLRFESEGAWKRAGTTVDSLAKELRLALQYPEGAAV